MGESGFRYMAMAALAAALIGIGLARADDTAPPPAGAPVDLDRLLQLPDSLDYSVERHGGETRSEWHARFRGARAARDEAKVALKKSQEELEGMAVGGDVWKIAPPGLPGGDLGGTPDTYRVRQDVKRHRTELERAERRLKDLIVEANLAGVPDDWRD